MEWCAKEGERERYKEEKTCIAMRNEDTSTLIRDGIIQLAPQYHISPSCMMKAICGQPSIHV